MAYTPGGLSVFTMNKHETETPAARTQRILDRVEHETATDLDLLKTQHAAWLVALRNVREASEMVARAEVTHEEFEQMRRELRLFLEIEERERKAFEAALRMTESAK